MPLRLETWWPFADICSFSRVDWMNIQDCLAGRHMGLSLYNRACMKTSKTTCSRTIARKCYDEYDDLSCGRFSVVNFCFSHACFGADACLLYIPSGSPNAGPIITILLWCRSTTATLISSSKVDRRACMVWLPAFSILAFLQQMMLFDRWISAVC